MRGVGFPARTGKGLASQHANIHCEGGSAYREVCIQGEGVGIKVEGDCIQGEGVCIWGEEVCIQGKGALHPGGGMGSASRWGIWQTPHPLDILIALPGIPNSPVLTSSDGHQSGWYASYWNVFTACNKGEGGMRATHALPVMHADPAMHTLPCHTHPPVMHDPCHTCSSGIL